MVKQPSELLNVLNCKNPEIKLVVERKSFGKVIYHGKFFGFANTNLKCPINKL